MLKPKINLFALPGQTTMLFWLIATTLLGAVLIGSSGSGPIPLAWLPLALILLSLRGFLERPSRDIRQNGLIPIGDDSPLLQKAIENGAQQIGLKRVPRVLVNQNQDADAIRAMGSFRRWYIVCNLKEAQSLEDRLIALESSSSAKAEILHELNHFKTGDYWQLGYLSELFQASFQLMFWVMGFFVGWFFLLSLATKAVLQFSPDSILDALPSETKSLLEPLISGAFPSPAEMESMRQKAANIDLFAVASFVVNISLPLIVLTAVLWWFYRARLWRMREFYADAGMIQTMGTTAPFWEMLNLNRVSREDSAHPRKGWADSALDTFGKIHKRMGHFIGDNNFSPPFAERGNALTSPQNVFYDWKKTAWLLGSLTLLLEIFLATPLTLQYIGKNPMHFATLVIVMATAYFLLPHILMGKSGWVQGLLIVVAVNIIRTLWLFFTLSFLWGLYFVQPSILFETLKSAVYSIARYAGNALFQIDLFDFLVRASVANLLQVPIIFAIQTLSILGLIFLFQRICTWYAFFPTNERFRHTVFGINFTILFILWTTFLPLSSAVVTDDLGSLLQPLNVVMVILGILVAIGGGFWFFIQDRRYHHQCPHCKTKVAASNLVGATCSSCKEPLFPWLLVNYEDE